MDKKILVAMSGGVDSTVCAHILKEQGYDIGGITMRVWDELCSVPEGDTQMSDQNCRDALSACNMLSIPHHIVSYEESFKRLIVERFIDDYINGLTPNPCVECNKSIKFGKLFESTRTMGYDMLATGHYAKIIQNGDSFELRRASDINKDQSYFLWAISKDILPFILFPLGNYTKPEIRAIASECRFESAHRSDSQDICFIANGEYASFIKQRRNRGFPMGDFIDINGNIIGKHLGIINYTIGQRKGLGVAFGKPMFVGAKNADKNTVMLCTDAELFSDTLTAHSVNLLVNTTLETPTRVVAKIRYRHTPAAATAYITDEGKLNVKFDLPQRAICAGQSVVLYDGDTVIGGGIIE